MCCNIFHRRNYAHYKIVVWIKMQIRCILNMVHIQIKVNEQKIAFKFKICVYVCVRALCNIPCTYNPCTYTKYSSGKMRGYWTITFAFDLESILYFKFDTVLWWKDWILGYIKCYVTAFDFATPMMTSAGAFKKINFLLFTDTIIYFSLLLFIINTFLFSRSPQSVTEN